MIRRPPRSTLCPYTPLFRAQRIAAGGGIEDGERVLDIVARHPATARHIPRKLAVRFVSDSPPPALVDPAGATFRRTNGDIQERKSTPLNSSHANISYTVFFLNDTATTEIYALSLHAALPSSAHRGGRRHRGRRARARHRGAPPGHRAPHRPQARGALRERLAPARPRRPRGCDLPPHERRHPRTEEHTTELQSRQYLVYRLFLK